MATANFGTPRYDLPLIAGGMSDDGWANECEFDNMRFEVEELNKDLKHFEVEIEGGYYQGFMLNAKQTDDYWDIEDIATITDEDADYFYGDTAEGVKKEFADDMAKIKQFFANAKDSGMMELAKVAQFSNGEAVYKRVK